MKTKKGFTLIELMVVMAIIAILSVLIVGAIQAARKQATNTQRTGNVKTIETALEARAAKCGGQYFATATGCATAVDTASLATIISSLSPTYITNALTIDSTAGYSVTTSAANNTYTINALDKADNTTVIYTAAR